MANWDMRLLAGVKELACCLMDSLCNQCLKIRNFVTDYMRICVTCLPMVFTIFRLRNFIKSHLVLDTFNLTLDSNK